MVLEELVLSLIVELEKNKRIVSSSFNCEVDPVTKKRIVKPFTEYDRNSFVLGYSLALDDIQRFLIKYITEKYQNQDLFVRGE